MKPQSYYYFIFPAVAAVLFLVFYAVSIVCSSSVKQLVVAERMKRGKLRRLPVRMYTKPESNTEEEECSVCLSAFIDGQLVRQLEHCRHSFHVACIDKWLTSHCTCPVCRSDLLLSGQQETGAASEV